MSAGADHAVFVSYASRDRTRALDIARQLEGAGVRLWIDRDRIAGGMNYGPEIARAIKAAKVLLLLCSDASLQSRNVKQEVQLAWKYQRPYLPLLLEPTTVPEQFEYWLEGWQWIEVFGTPPEQWLAATLRALGSAGVKLPESAAVSQPDTGVVSSPPLDLNGLRSIARFTDRIWPLPAGRAHRGRPVPLRDLGAPQDDVEHGHRLGSRLALAIESDTDGHLTLIDEGTTGTVYCLCPSAFAPDTRLPAGRSYVPQPGSRYDSLTVSGEPGREHLLAVITQASLRLDWQPRDPRVPARVLSPGDIADLVTRVRALPDGSWTALATYFDVLP